MAAFFNFVRDALTLGWRGIFKTGCTLGRYIR
jgi:hypothetical protein